MKSIPTLVRRFLAAVLFAGLTWAGFAAQSSRVFVEFKPGQKAVAKGLLLRTGGQIHHEFDALNAVAVSLPSAALNGLRNHPSVALIEDDPQRFLFTESVPYGVDLVQASALWDANHDGILDAGAVTGAGIKIGVIDSGVFTGHQDFAGVTITGEPAGWNSDGLGHGTHVSGTLAAALNGVGVVGVSPGGVSLHMVRVFGDTGGWIYSSSLIAAANKCRDAGCKIISMSLGGSFRSRTEDRGFASLYNGDILLVAAAGNGGNTAISYPAGYASVISVAAIDAAKVVASFSQKNKDVELAAPGVSVLSTVPNGYAYYDGTSMATPHVAAVAALIWSGAPGKSNAQVRTALTATAQDLGTASRDNSYGFGLIRAVNALNYLRTN